jgi:EVE domain
MTSNEISHWLLVERLANWEHDCANGFRLFGIPGSKKGLADKIRRGDVLIFYVSSGVSSFADIREAKEDGVQPMIRGEDYATKYPWKIISRPILTLARDRWVHMNSLAERLSLTSGMSHWRNAVRSSLHRLEPQDAALILESMRRAKAAAEHTA